MRIDIEGLEVLFPFDQVYQEQYEYMLEFKHSLDINDGSGHAMLEMPTGTGKTMCILALVLAYQQVNPTIGSLIYCTRTIPELNQCMRELKRLVQYRNDILKDNCKPILGVCMTSRKNLCINSEIDMSQSGEYIDGECKNKISSWQRDKYKEGDSSVLRDGFSPCSYYEQYNENDTNNNILLPNGVYSIDTLREYGIKNNMCPYFLTRQALSYSNVIVMSYQYVLDPRISSLLTDDVFNNNNSKYICVFDEGHNIENICMETLSLTLTKYILRKANQGVEIIEKCYESSMKQNKQKLDKEIQKLKENVLSLDLSKQSIANTTIGPPLIDGIIQDKLSVKLRNPPSFIRKLKSYISLLDKYLRPEGIHIRDIQKFQLEIKAEDHSATASASSVGELGLFHQFWTRYSSLLNTLEVTNTNRDELQCLQKVVDFLTMIGTYKEGFFIIQENSEIPPSSEMKKLDSILELCCVDPTIVFSRIIKRFQHILITSGTLSPMSMYEQLLDFHPSIKRSITLSLHYNNICPVIINRGNDQTKMSVVMESLNTVDTVTQMIDQSFTKVRISTSYEYRDDENTIRHYGLLLLSLAQKIPDGIICFMTSYQHLESCLKNWHDMRIINDIFKYKLIFVESRNSEETLLALNNYKHACDIGRGALFLCVTRGRIAEGVDFSGHYGRCAVMIGIPFQYALSRELRVRLDYFHQKYNILEEDYYQFDALRQTAQCVGRTVRNKKDYSICVFADARYSLEKYKSKLPEWIKRQLPDSNVNLTTEMASVTIARFLKDIAQRDNQKSNNFTFNEQQLKEYIAKQQQ